MKSNLTLGDIRPLINRNKLWKHHAAYCRGYVSRKLWPDDWPAVPYKGRFGEGYKVFCPAYNSSRYCIVQYWIF